MKPFPSAFPDLLPKSPSDFNSVTLCVPSKAHRVDGQCSAKILVNDLDKRMSGPNKFVVQKYSSVGTKEPFTAAFLGLTDLVDAASFDPNKKIGIKNN